ncbi:NTE family protein [Arthrobacter alpinus]|uniref:NTE family protein n=1 Tax=Arthrobacter alpinus TaxID=656366 RepID=A0A1H5IB20_9MICC|nr:patatin-like phospholipase family protein [Arthrobacter alpinus]SEE37402.1 NTE family protein [Arthrobacter alpinus]
MNSIPFSTRHITLATATIHPDSFQDQPRFNATTTLAAAGGRALVLGGGGSTGNAWLIGVTAGLFETGVDVTGADLIIGTSAGSTAAAQITGASPTQLFADTLAAVSVAQKAPPGTEKGQAPVLPVDHLGRIKKIIAAAQNPAEMRHRLGASALEMESALDGSWSTRWRSTVAARLPCQDWPEQEVVITAVDATTGEPVMFDRHSGVDLADAVAASCSSGLPYRIGDNAFIDGGYRRSGENADLAAGFERVLLLSPFGGKSLQPLAWGLQLSAQLEELDAGGSRVETISPDTSAEYMFGANAMDLSMRPSAARAGYEQGKALAERLGEFWH